MKPGRNSVPVTEPTMSQNLWIVSTGSNPTLDAFKIPKSKTKNRDPRVEAYIPKYVPMAMYPYFFHIVLNLPVNEVFTSAGVVLSEENNRREVSIDFNGCC